MLLKKNMFLKDVFFIVLIYFDWFFFWSFKNNKRNVCSNFFLKIKKIFLLEIVEEKWRDKLDELLIGEWMFCCLLMMLYNVLLFIR